MSRTSPKSPYLEIHEAAVIDRASKIVIKRIRFANFHVDFLKFMDAIKKSMRLPNLAWKSPIIIGCHSMLTFFKPNKMFTSCVSSSSIWLVCNLKRKIIALLDQIFPEVELLADYTTPEEMLPVDTQKLADLLNKA